MPLRPDDDARRAYWTQQMDEAHAFMTAMVGYPVRECGEPMEPLVEAAAAAGIEVATSATLFPERRPRLYFLRAGLRRAFLAAAREMNERGWILKLEDGYRSAAMQRSNARREEVFHGIVRSVQWECRGAKPPVDLIYRRFGVLIANMPKVGTHMSGSAIDISVLHRDTIKQLGQLEAVAAATQSELQQGLMKFEAELGKLRAAKDTAVTAVKVAMSRPSEQLLKVAEQQVKTPVQPAQLLLDRGQLPFRIR